MPGIESRWYPRVTALAGRPRRRRAVVAVVAVLAVVVAGAVLGRGLRPAGGTDRTTSGPPTLIRSDPAPALAGTTVSGDTIDLAALRGRPVLVNMRAAWCDPCRGELPLLAGAAGRWAADGLAVVTVAVRDDPDAARRLLAELGLTSLPAVVDRSESLSCRGAWSAFPRRS